MYYLYWKVIRENGFVPYLGACRISEVPLLEAYLYIQTTTLTNRLYI